MNIAFSSLLILILFLPGIIFRLTIIKSDSLENPLDTSRIAELVFVLIPSIILHALAYIFIEKIVKTNIHLDQLYFLLIGNTKAIEKLNIQSIIEPSFIPFLMYILVLCIVAGILGYLSKKAILHWNLDLKKPTIFAISNEWDNILSGRIFIHQRTIDLNEELKVLIETKDSKGITEKKQQIANLAIDFIDVDVLVNSAGKSIIYQGTLLDYFLAKGNSIDKLYLINPSRKEANTPEEFTPIPSDTIVLKNEHILNLNFRIGWAVEEEQ